MIKLTGYGLAIDGESLFRLNFYLPIKSGFQS